jgi:hypothetical protein
VCLPNTRAQVLGEIMTWARHGDGNDNGDDDNVCDKGNGSGDGRIGGISSSSSSCCCGRKRIYWLNGMAGTGKSTIA